MDNAVIRKVLVTMCLKAQPLDGKEIIALWLQHNVVKSEKVICLPDKSQENEEKNGTNDSIHIHSIG